MILTSSAFEPDGPIPEAFSCNGLNISPPLTITDTPPGTKALALTLVDPDAPSGNFVHWLWWNLPPNTVEIKPGELPASAIVGTNSSGKAAYSGPCPPEGTHHYVFKLFALDSELPLNSDAKFDQLNQSIANHVLDEAQLTGTFTHS